MKRFDNEQANPSEAEEAPVDADEKIRLSWFERLYDFPAARKTAVFLFLIVCWEIYARYLDNALMFPTFMDTLRGLAEAFQSGELVERITVSLKVQLTGYLIGVLLAVLLTLLAMSGKFGADVLELLTAMFNPLPPIALLPLALLWFGLGYPGIVFVIVHAVTWPIALNIYNGFSGVSNTLRMVGRNYELRGPAFAFRILIPAAFPSILTGLKVGWAFSWRTLIASELVFGVSSGNGGLGWFIYEKKNQLDIHLVFAGLLTVILIGVLIEHCVFRPIEKHTVMRWGMKF
jgi:NitT/TauT family transport system permease protein